MDSLDENYRKSLDEVKKIKNVNIETRLKLYGLFKQIQFGDCRVKKPRFYDQKGVKKWEAWEKLKGKEKNHCKKEYIEIVAKLK